MLVVVVVGVDGVVVVVGVGGSVAVVLGVGGCSGRGGSDSSGRVLPL